MGILISRNQTCGLCQSPLGSENRIGFPAFVPKNHRFSQYSDCVYHERCFNQWPNQVTFLALYEAYKEVWKTRPRGASMAQADAWGKHAFDKIFAAGMLK